MKTTEQSCIDDENVERFKKRCIEPFFPNARPVTISGIGPASMEKFGSVEIEFGSSFENLIGSPYQYTDSYKFLHFTTLKALLNILKEGRIRMYNLREMDDPRELNYATENLGIKYTCKYEKAWKTDGYYALSMFKKSIEKQKKSLNAWRTYGDDGNGVALELTFHKKHAQYWHGFALSRMYYGEKGFEHFKQFQNAYKHFQEEVGFGIDNFDELFNLVWGFHKTGTYTTEDEVRLLYTLRGLTVYSDALLDKRKKEHPAIHLDVTSKKMPTDYFELQLNYDGWKQWKNHPYIKPQEIKQIYPAVSISKVIFGYRLSEKQKKSIFYALAEMHPKIRFEDSTLTPDFNTGSI